MQQALPPESNEHYLEISTGNVLERFLPIRTFMLDVDGVLTNNEVLITEEGALLRTMHVRDGYAIQLALRQGYQVFVITGGKSRGVADRLRALGIQDIASNVRNKLGAYEEYLDVYGLEESRILYMGDDLPDYDVMRRVGLPVCPSDAAQEIMAICPYVSPLPGGKGCVRDVIEKVLKLNGHWK
jgi:3-deoxy-D-manno-octulosonate 8-phosphate phosphatase (KDO 8-P phosphatase)